ncbi:hypothetical protein, partial [Pseudomonas iridis]
LSFCRRLGLAHFTISELQNCMFNRANHMKKKWNSEFDAFLKENINKLSKDKIAITLGVKPDAIDRARVRLGLPAFPKWASEDDRILAENAEIKTISELASMLQRSKSQIDIRLDWLGKTAKAVSSEKQSYLSENQKEIIKKNRLRLSFKQIKKLLGISTSHLKGALNTLNIELKHKSPFSVDEVSYIAQNYANRGARHCAEHIGRTKKSVEAKALSLKIKMGNKKIWTIEDDRFLVENIQMLGCEQVALELGRTLAAVKFRRAFLKPTRERRVFSKAEIDFIIDNYSSFGCVWISNELNTSVDKVVGKANRLGLKPVSRILLSMDIEFIRDNYQKYGATWVAERISCTIQNVLEIANEFELTFKRTRWTKDEDKFLLDNYQNLTLREISEKLNRPYKSTVTRRTRLFKKTTYNP